MATRAAEYSAEGRRISRVDILVCVKQVPGTTKVEVDSETGVLKRAGIAAKLNPYDLNAVEMALNLAEECGGAVHTLTMGPLQARQVLLETIYMGAKSGVLISDRRFSGADVLATAYTLSQAIKKIDSYDLILCGKQTTDGDTAQVGAELAEFLNIPHAANVQKIQLWNDCVTVRLLQEDRIVTQRLPFPCLLCIDADVNTPRLPSYKLKRDLKKEPVVLWSLEDLPDKEERHYGMDGSPTRVERIFPPEVFDSRETFSGDALSIAKQLTAALAAKKFIYTNPKSKG
jgi:electron transfer flavoprotein beta subunit